MKSRLFIGNVDRFFPLQLIILVNQLKTLLPIVWSIFLYLSICSTPLKAQLIKKGGNINGEAIGDESGRAISMPDSNTIAIGAHLNNNSFFDAGHVRIYRWNGSSWTQKGLDIDGEAAADLSGRSVSMPDANTVAIGALGNDGPNGMNLTAGHVRIYRWNGTSWIQKGADIDGEAAGDESGIVSMPDPNTVAIGASKNDGLNGMTTDVGHVRIFAWNGTSWVQKGNDIDGESAFDGSGGSVSMPDNNTVAIGASRNDGNFTTPNSNRGHVRVYKWDGLTWVQKGSDIDGELIGSLSGHIVSMPDSNTLAIGAPLNSGNGSEAGHARVYHWVGNAWVQKGADIDGTAGDRLGISVSMCDSNTISVGAPNSGNYGPLSGYTQTFRWSGTSWVKIGTDIAGDGWYDNFGSSVSMPDPSHMAAGGPGNDGNSGFTSNGGHVRIFKVCDVATYDSISPVVCKSYLSPSRTQIYTSSGIYSDTLVGSKGCDSVIISIDLTITGPIQDTMSAIACNQYVSPSGNFTWVNSGTYLDTIIATSACDSIITVNLIIYKDADTNIIATGCNEYISPSGKYIWNTNGTYLDTIATLAGCDSVITINLGMVFISTRVLINGITLISYEPNASYQWLRCDSSFIPIAGETNQSFTPTISGSYAVEVTKNSCTDTSECFVYTSIAENFLDQRLRVFPNPTEGKVVLSFSKQHPSIVAVVRNVIGQEFFRQTYLNTDHIELNIEGESGIYYLELIGERDQKARIKIVKE